MCKLPVRLAWRVQRRLILFMHSHPDIELPCDPKESQRQLTQIAERNFSTGRYQHYRRHNRAPVNLTPTRYLDHLIETWIQEAPFYERLHKADPRAWEELRGVLTQAARPMLGRHPSTETSEDYAQRACAKILEAEYPFDIPFLWWAQTILQNMVLARGRSKDRFNDRVFSLDASPNPNLGEASLEWAIPDPMAQTLLDAVDDRELLVRVLRRLNRQRFQVIVLSYFEEWDDEMIADALQIKPANVQTIRHRALDQLAEMLSKKPLSVKQQRRHRINKKRSHARKKK